MSAGPSDGVYQSVTPELGSQRPPWAVSLSKEALFRIQLSLASRRSSVMVLETVCRIFTGTLQQRETPVRVQDLDPGDTDWIYQTTGVPGLLVEYRDIRDMSIFSLKLVVIEVESGLCTWEGKFGGEANYQVFAEDFHTFWLPGLGQVGIEFGDLSEGERMRVLLREWLERLRNSALLLAQQETDNSLKKKKKSSVISRSESQPRLDKKQISTPCNFIHVSGITMTRTQECEKELQGSVRRFFRGAVSSLTRTNTISPVSKVRPSRDKSSLAASSLGDLSCEPSKRSLPNGRASPGPPSSQPAQTTECDNKFSSLPRKKKGTSSRSHSPETGASVADDVTPNSRRKGIVQARVITSDDYSYQESQRRATVAAGPDRSRPDHRKLSAPNIRSHPPLQHPDLWRQYSHQTNQSDGMYGRAASYSQTADYNSQIQTSDNLPPYRPPPLSYPANQSDLSVPAPTQPPSHLTAGLGYPQGPPGSHGHPQDPPGPHGYPQGPPGSHGYPQDPPGSHGYPQDPPGSHGYPQDPSGPLEAPLRSGQRGQARMSERRDLKRLSNSYTSFGHVGSTQVDV